MQGFVFRTALAKYFLHKLVIALNKVILYSLLLLSTIPMKRQLLRITYTLVFLTFKARTPKRCHNTLVISNKSQWFSLNCFQSQE